MLGVVLTNVVGNNPFEPSVDTVEQVVGRVLKDDRVQVAPAIRTRGDNQRGAIDGNRDDSAYGSGRWLKMHRCDAALTDPKIPDRALVVLDHDVLAFNKKRAVAAHVTND